MRRNTFLTKLVVFSMVSLLFVPAVAAEEKDPVAGVWLLESDFNGRTVNSMLMISKDNGSYEGKWVNFWGMNETENLKVEDSKVTFTLTNEFQGQEFTLDFSGTIEDGKMTAAMTSDQWDSEFEGSRMKPVEPIIGTWEFRRRRGDREFVSTLTVSRDDDKFNVDWQGSRGRRGDDEDDEDEEDEDRWEISDISYENGKLTFTRKRTDSERQRQATYSLTAEDDTITGTMTTSRGERELEGKRLGGDLIGKWELTVTSEMGQRKQLLWIQPDMTAMYGSTDVGKINVEDDMVSFDYEMEFGDRTFENAFKGKLEDGTLTGEITNSRGTQQVKGKKMD